MIFEEKSTNFDKNKTLITTFSDCGILISKQLLKLSSDDLDYLKTEISYYYNDLGWGLKVVARNVLGISYSECRTLFKNLGLTFRTGYNVVTDNLKEFRKQKAINETECNIGFRNPELKRFAEKTNRGVQGYYYNKSNQEYVWLRSTYEYIYAKFLNKIGVNWKIEEQYFLLSDNTKYSPDFYIYDENWNLIQIVEIKGYYDCRAYKVDLLKTEHFSDTNIDFVLIKDINKYIPTGQTYLSELKTWKQIRKSKNHESKESAQ